MRFQAGEPPGDAVAQAHAVGVHVHGGGEVRRSQRWIAEIIDAVVGGGRFPAVDLFLVAPVPQDGAPPARARVGRARPIGEDLDDPGSRLRHTW